MSERENAGVNGTGEAADRCGHLARPGRHGGGCSEWGWWEDRSLPQKILIGIGFGILGIGLLFLCGWVVMLLWNWLMPDLLGVGRLTYWKAWGLLVLCWILFKSWGAGGSGNRTERQRKQQLRRLVREDQRPPAAAPNAGVQPG